MITNEQIISYLNSLIPHTMTSERETQKWRVPYIIKNDKDPDHYSTYDEDDRLVNWYTLKRANVHPVKKYRFDGKWFYERESVDDPEMNFGILHMNNLPYNSFSERANKKSFVSRLDKLVFQGFIEPLMIFIDNKFVNWDDITLVYDCDDSWLLLYGDKYTYSKILYSDISVVILPFRCDYIGYESDDSFKLNLEALTEYLQETAYEDTTSQKLYLKVPTMDTEYEYNHMMFNIGGWMYAQIKKYFLGELSTDRINKLRRIEVYKYIYDSNGEPINTKVTRFNVLDRDVYTDQALFDAMCYMNREYYEQHQFMKFTDDGLLDNTNGIHGLYFVDEKTIINYENSSERLVITDLSDVDNVLFRENYFIFKNGLVDLDYPIITSINNITLCDNADLDKLEIYSIYHIDSAHVIRNSDAFLKSYMNEQALKYLEVLYASNYTPITGVDAHIISSYKIIKALDYIKNGMHTAGFVPSINDYIAYLDGSIDAHLFNSRIFTSPGEVIKNVTYFTMSRDEDPYIPTPSENFVFLDDLNDMAVKTVGRAVEPFDFKMDRSKTYEENVEDCLDAIIDYNPLLLNGLYHTYIDSKVFTGKQANESLLYTFLYNSSRGIKIPRKRYKNHESYMLLFLNGELYENYYKTIAYANFFFIPVDDDFEFRDSDRIEVMYFKNVNNNELRFIMSDWVLQQFQQNGQDINFYNLDIFDEFITPEELQIFSHYPKSMLHYPTLIKEPSELIAFNVSYRDDDNNLCVRKEFIESAIESKFDQSDLEEFKETSDISNLSLTEYADLLKENVTITAKGVNLYTDLHDAEIEAQNILVATSKHKFVYQRLYVDQKCYRIELDKRFRYCDVQRQYLLFINGRRMKQDSFLVTVPKHTRPFTGLYLYTARFVTPKDRVELFYLPYEMTDLNIDNSTRSELMSNGYFVYDRTDLDVPFSKDLYAFFINGKKIPYTDIIDVDSHTIRLAVDTNTLKYPAVTCIAVDSIPKVANYLKDRSQMSKYDDLIDYIRTRSLKSYNELDRLFGCYTQMSDIEEDKVWADVAKIAILNEIVRDFWVTSGYPYQKELFTYDYEEDEIYYVYDDGVLNLPALDATQEINIPKNQIDLLYFYTEPNDLVYEIGSTTSSFKFFWEYSQRLNQDLVIVGQDINGVEIDTGAREYEWFEDLTSGKNFKFSANTGQEILVRNVYLDFVNGIYWGLIDEDQLQYYVSKMTVFFLDDLIAIMPKDGVIPTEAEQRLEYGDPKWQFKIEEENYIIHNITYDEATSSKYSPWERVPEGTINVYQEGEPVHAQIMDEDNNFTGEVMYDIFGQIIWHNMFYHTNRVNIYDENFIAIVDKEAGSATDDEENGISVYDPITKSKEKWSKIRFQLLDRIIDNKPLYNNEAELEAMYNRYGMVWKDKMNTLREYYDESDIPDIIRRLDKHLLRSSDIYIDDYVIGNNKYFIFACPKRLVTNDSINYTSEFYFPDIKSDDVRAHCRDDRTTPVYTNGRFDEKNKNLVELENMGMIYMGEADYTNDYGYTERYMMWRTNGFFTRLFENYPMDIHIKIGEKFDRVGFGGDDNGTTVKYDENGNIVNPYQDILDLAEKTRQEKENNDEDDGDAGSNGNGMLGTTSYIGRTDRTGFNRSIGVMNNTENDVNNNSNGNTEENSNANEGVEIMDSESNKDASKVRRLLDQGIFLI